MIWPDPTPGGVVYQPAEDSNLLAEAAVTRVGPGDVVLDVGTGSGYVAARAAETGASVVATDVNPHACEEARERFGTGRPSADRDPLASPASPIAVVRAHLCSPFRDASFDAVLFNPPYLPMDPDTEQDDWMAFALSGGESGRSVIEPFLANVSRVLTSGGFVLLLVSSLSGMDAVHTLADQAGFSAAAVAEESFPYETLTVLKLVPS